MKRSSLILSLFHDSVEGLKVKTSRSVHMNYEIKGLFGKSQARTKHKPSHFHSNSDSNIITSSLVTNLVTWFADLFCDFAKELNKKARANTKNKRNIFTLSALRYEMVDESVSIEGTLSNSVYFVPQQENSGCSRACVMNSVYNAQWEFVVYGLWYANWPTTMNFLYLLKTSLFCTVIWYGEFRPLSVKISCLVFM